MAKKKYRRYSHEFKHIIVSRLVDVSICHGENIPSL